jgi:aspartyl-tRNA(Asn)/glutamyl-tRNA(Gln) amidotransferase subunit B
MSDATYKMTVGLEIHAELKTKSKMFCGCLNFPEEKNPNINVCPICMGHPGTLPVINKEAVKKVLLVGTSIGGEIADFTEFDRKNYFYPDIPKGYQISQYKYPLVSGGTINGIKLTRIHLEEDTARSTHENTDFSLVDFNRAGVPLLELVTEPVITSAEEATTFAKELQLLLQYLGASDANMEKGEMRVEVNISVSKDEKFGTKVEVKNINSFRAAGKAIEFELKRQSEVLDRGEKVVQETRGWNEAKQATFSQRSKESAHDYRYFPEPDLPKLLISEIPEFSKESLTLDLKETPKDKRERLSLKFNLKPTDIETYINNKKASDFFESISSLVGEGIQVASNYITSDIVGLSKNSEEGFALGKINKENFSKLISMISSGDLSSRGAKDILKILFEDGGDSEVIAQEKNLIQKSNPEELKNIIESILNNNKGVVEEYKNGKESVLQFLIGQGMKETKGSANPELLKKIILDLLK